MKKYLFLICLILVSCKTTQTTTNSQHKEQTVKIDSVYIKQFVHDTTYVEKETYVEVKGDCKDSIVKQTIYKEKIIKDTINNNASSIDTVYINTTDTIIKEVPAELNWYHQTWIGLGWIFLIIILGKVGWIIIKRKL
jgi:hypothetical protein